MSEKLPRVPASRIITLLKNWDSSVYAKAGVTKFLKRCWYQGNRTGTFRENPAPENCETDL